MLFTSLAGGKTKNWGLMLSMKRRRKLLLEKREEKVWEKE